MHDNHFIIQLRTLCTSSIYALNVGAPAAKHERLQYTDSVQYGAHIALDNTCTSMKLERQCLVRGSEPTLPA